MKFLRQIFFLLFLLAPLISFANTFPNLINFQSVLRDDDGNLITSNFIDLEFKILDQDGDQLYYEQQPGVQVVRSSVNVMIGEGIIPSSNPTSATGGIPSTALDPTSGTKLLQIKIGNNQPSDPIELGVTPYSFWSEKAVSVVNNAISSEHIKNASIKLEDLEPNILSFAQVTGQIGENQIPNTIARVTALNAHINARSSAHLATAIQLERAIGFSASLNLEEALRDLDRGLFSEVFNRSQNRDTLTAADRTLTTNLETHTRATTAHGSDGTVVGLNTLNRALAAQTAPAITGGTITGATITGGTFNGALNNTTGNHTGTVEAIDVSDLNGAVSNHTSSGNTTAHSFSNISGTLATTRLSGPVTSIASNGLGSLATLSSVSGGSGGTIADGTITTADLLASSFVSWDQNAGDDFTQAQGDGRYVNVAGGDAMAGPLQVNGNIGVTGTVDGVDVDTFSTNTATTLASHDGRLRRLEGVPIDETTVPSRLRPFAFGAYVPSTVRNAYNARYVGDGDCGGSFPIGIGIDFTSTVPTDANYSVIVTPTAPIPTTGLSGSSSFFVTNKRPVGFVICSPSSVPGTPFDFVVFKY